MYVSIGKYHIHRWMLYRMFYWMHNWRCGGNDMCWFGSPTALTFVEGWRRPGWRLFLCVIPDEYFNLTLKTGGWCVLAAVLRRSGCCWVSWSDASEGQAARVHVCFSSSGTTRGRAHRQHWVTKPFYFCLMNRKYEYCYIRVESQISHIQHMFGKPVHVQYLNVIK